MDKIEIRAKALELAVQALSSAKWESGMAMAKFALEVAQTYERYIEEGAVSPPQPYQNYR